MSIMVGHPRNPLRPPDWRWVFARALLEEGLPFPGVEDEWTRRARHVQQALKDRGDDPDHTDVIRVDPLLVAAYKLRYGDNLLAAEINARLLADQSFEGITARTGVPADVLVVYEKVFYCVLDQLECSDWIAAFCFGARFYTDLQEDDTALVWAWFGYNLGPYGLDDVIDSLYGGSSGGVRAEDTEGITMSAARNRALIQVLTLPKDVASAPSVLALVELQEWLDREVADNRGGFVMAPLVVGDPMVASIAAAIETGGKTDIRADDPDVVDAPGADGELEPRTDGESESGKDQRRTA